MPISYHKMLQVKKVTIIVDDEVSLGFRFLHPLFAHSGLFCTFWVCHYFLRSVSLDTLCRRTNCDRKFQISCVNFMSHFMSSLICELHCSYILWKLVCQPFPYSVLMISVFQLSNILCQLICECQLSHILCQWYLNVIYQTFCIHWSLYFSFPIFCVSCYVNAIFSILCVNECLSVIIQITCVNWCLNSTFSIYCVTLWIVLCHLSNFIPCLMCPLMYECQLPLTLYLSVVIYIWKFIHLKRNKIRHKCPVY